MSRYLEEDLGKVRTYSIAQRRSLVNKDALYRPPRRADSFAEFWRSMPDVLAARDLKELVARVCAARARGRGVLVMAGAHVIKTGLSPGLIRLLEGGWITGLALNGAGAIHDLELAFFGGTSEDVGEALPRGRFGMARETSTWLNQWISEAARRQEGLGEGLGRAFLEHARSGGKRSLLATCYRLGVPATVHLSIGADINHQHSGFDGAAAGETSSRDFRILCAEVGRLTSGVALNLGSAVVLPEVFLKAVSVSTNLGRRFSGLTTAVFDFQRQYRPLENVVRRPALQGGRGYYLVGHHEILLPLFFQALLWAGGGRARSAVPETGRRKRSRQTTGIERRSQLHRPGQRRI
jgi:hypothetical protein